MNAVNTDLTPWYRQPWPWILMAGPAIVVVAGFVTLGLAIQSSDGLVADDYYNQGKAINKTMHRDDKARELDYRVEIKLTNDGGRVALSFLQAVPPAKVLRMTLSHPTRSGLDRIIKLEKIADGTYTAAMPAIESARWKVIVDDETVVWRLTGEWLPGSGKIELGARN